MEGVYDSAEAMAHLPDVPSRLLTRREQTIETCRRYLEWLDRAEADANPGR
jgi:hypothetical protein